MSRIYVLGSRCRPFCCGKIKFQHIRYYAVTRSGAPNRYVHRANIFFWESNRDFGHGKGTYNGIVRKDTKSKGRVTSLHEMSHYAVTS